MWYSASGGIGLATSTAPVLSPGAGGSFDANAVSGPCVLFQGGMYRMWYDAESGTGARSIGHATSSDGISWTKHPTSVLQTGAVGFDDQEVEEPRVVFDGTVYRMWYAGSSSSGLGGIGYAVSNDGLVWSKYAGSPVIAPGPDAWDHDSLEGPCVLIDGGVYKMWYQGNDGILDEGRIGYAAWP